MRDFKCDYIDKNHAGWRERKETYILHPDSINIDTMVPGKNLFEVMSDAQVIDNRVSVLRNEISLGELYSYLL